MPDLILRVAIPVPLHSSYDYLPLEGEDVSELLPGKRLMVPFGKGRRCGVLLEVTSETKVSVAKLKPVLGVLDEVPLFSPEHLDYLRWLSDYYHHPLGEVLAAALPVRLRKGKAQLSTGQPGWALTDEGRAATPADLVRAPRQARVLEFLQQSGGEATRSALRHTLGTVGPVIKAMEAKQLVVPRELKSGFKPAAHASHLKLNKQQVEAVAAVSATPGVYSAYLLDGVTGSGKTEVYLRLADTVLQQGRQVLMLVPEISLTPQLVERCRARLPYQMTLFHSALNEREREIAWHQARSGEARIVIGTRSAVLAPLPDLGLVLVDEEHDASLKQQEGFRYSARDMAIVRARRADCPVVLGSATPSLESLNNVVQGKYRHLQLKQRAGGARPPAVKLVDIRNKQLSGGLSPSLLTEIERTLAEGQQAMVFLNRRGFAPVLTCYSCGWISDCPSCDAHQTLHAAQGLLWCHHCGAQRQAPRVCPQCGQADLHPLGQGTEQLEQVLQQRFPDYPLVRIDRDATRRKGSLDRLLTKAREGKAALLVGTQMLAKGHHFPGVALVGILDVDGGLFAADFRAAERMAQLLIQVAGRAGRGEQLGRVLIQTRFPDHPLLQTLVNQGYASFARQALDERRSAELPPFSYQALIRASAVDEEQVNAFLESAANLVASAGIEAVSLWGPAPAPMQRRAGRYRAHLLVQAVERVPLHRALSILVSHLQLNRVKGSVRWSLDVDPQDLY